MVTEVKAKIAPEVLSSFTTSVSECNKVVDLKIPSKLLFEQITALVFQITEWNYYAQICHNIIKLI